MAKDLLELYASYKYYIAVKEAKYKIYRPYGLKKGYTTLLNATLFTADKLELLKAEINKLVDSAENTEGICMQIKEIATRKVVYERKPTNSKTVVTPTKMHNRFESI